MESTIVDNDFYGGLLGCRLPDNKRFKLRANIIDKYRNKVPPFGFNGLGELVYLRTYARDKENGSIETWIDTVERVVNGVFEILQHYIINKLHCDCSNLKLEELSEKMFERIFDMKFLPPGRGLWAMGSPIIRKKGFAAALNNCAFVSTQSLDKDKIGPFTFLMDASMLGVGVGFDTNGADSFIIKHPNDKKIIHTISDDREGWVNSLQLLLSSYFEGTEEIEFDYSKIREIGVKLKTFGGTSSGPGPLITLHKNIKKLLSENIGKNISVTNITDIMNIIGVCTVSGNIRRCIPINSLIHTYEGLVKIQNVTIGTYVLTSKGIYEPITNIFIQGKQKLLKIYTQCGYFKCTPNHRVAILLDKDNYSWIEAKNLTLNHKLITSRIPIIGIPTYLPSSNDINVPKLTTDMAWFIGFFYNEGYYDITDNETKIVIHVYNNNENIYLKVITQLYMFDCNVKIDIQPILYKTRKCLNIICKSPTIVKYFLENIKKYGIKITIPYYINQGLLNIRLAFIAGLVDSTENVYAKKIYITQTTYKSFIKNVQILCYSCGFETKILYNNIRLYKYVLIASTPFSKYIINSIPQLYQKSNFIIDKCYYNELNNSLFYSTQIKKLEYVKNEKETYDIEVKNSHNFYCNGYLVHNSAEIAFGNAECTEFLNLKSYEINPQRQEYGWASNNSIFAKIGMDYTETCKRIIVNGEPGFAWLSNMQEFSRMNGISDYKDIRVSGGNPCLEQSLESMELCCLVETFPDKHKDLEEFKETLYLAFLYAKIVTLLPLHWPKSNEIMLRNRRIGCSVSGIAQFITNKGINELKLWLEEGYNHVNESDKKISEWLCVRNSIKMTSVKPSGTISLLAGATPGIHYPESTYYIRRVRLARNHQLLNNLFKAGYHIEPCVVNPETTVIVSFPIAMNEKIRTLDNISMWEQLSLSAFMQKYWADNQVSATITFDPELEGEHLVHALNYFQYQLKGISFLPRSKTLSSAYSQMPYETITKEQYLQLTSHIKKNISLSTGCEQNMQEDVYVNYCDTDQCYRY